MIKPLYWSVPDSLRFVNSKDEILEVSIFSYEELEKPVYVCIRCSRTGKIYCSPFTLDGFIHEDRRESPFNIVQIFRKPMTFKQFVHLLIDFGTLIQIKHKNGTTEAFQVDIINVFKEVITERNTFKSYLFNLDFVNNHIYSIDGGETYQDFYIEEKR